MEVVSTYINIKVRKDLQTKILSIFPWPAKDYLTIYLISNRSWYLFKTNKFVIFEQKNNCDFQGPDIKEKSLDAGGRKSSSSWWFSSDCFVDESLLSELTEPEDRRHVGHDEDRLQEFVHQLSRFPTTE